MSGLPARDFGSDWVQRAEVVREHNRAELQMVLEALKPSVQGLYGPIQPRVVEVYLKALDQLGKLYRVYDRPPAAEEVGEEPAAVARREVEAARAAVLAQFEQLRARGRGV